MSDHGPIRAATESSIAAAAHLTSMDDGAVAALRAVADSFDFLVANDGCNAKGSFDNVTPAKYLSYCESLGLTPAGRGEKLDVKGGATTGRLAQLRSIKGA